jgi:hypothetical protein
MEDRDLADRHLFIIARDQPRLWDYLRREFSSEENVEVILDRRRKRERRSARNGGARPDLVDETPSDGRIGDRRLRESVDGQLRSIGYVMLRVR